MTAGYYRRSSIWSCGRPPEKYFREVVVAANGRALEVGVGPGLNFPLYGKQVKIIFGIDPSRRLLAIARGRAAAAGGPRASCRRQRPRFLSLTIGRYRGDDLDAKDFRVEERKSISGSGRRRGACLSRSTVPRVATDPRGDKGNPNKRIRIPPAVVRTNLSGVWRS
jgi:hypothetical protein